MDFRYIHFNQINSVECIQYRQKLVVNRGIHSFIPQSFSRQGHSLFRSEFSRQCGLVAVVNNADILNCLLPCSGLLLFRQEALLLKQIQAGTYYAGAGFASPHFLSRYQSETLKVPFSEHLTYITTVSKKQICISFISECIESFSLGL